MTARLTARLTAPLALLLTLILLAGCSATGTSDRASSRDVALTVPTRAAFEVGSVEESLEPRSPGPIGAFASRPSLASESSLAGSTPGPGGALAGLAGAGMVRPVNNITGFAALYESPSIQFMAGVYLVAGLPSGLALLPITVWFGTDAILYGFFPTGALPAIILGAPAILIEIAIRRLSS